jgi:hypothetical protein
MSHQDVAAPSRLGRRAALRAGAAVGAMGVSLAGGAIPTAAQGVAGRTMHLEVDAVIGAPVTITRAGSGPPQRGDWFFVDAVLYDVGATDGPAIGTYQCFGAWTHASTDTSAPDQRFTSVQFSLDGRGAIMGLINEAGADPSSHVGAVQGGTDDFAGVSGTFRQVNLTGAITGVTPGQPVARGIIDLILPGVSQGPTGAK